MAARAELGLLPGRMGRHTYGMRSGWRSLGRLTGRSTAANCRRKARSSAMRAALLWKSVLTGMRTALMMLFRDPSVGFPDRTLPGQVAEGNVRNSLWDKEDGVFGRDSL